MARSPKGNDVRRRKRHELLSQFVKDCEEYKRTNNLPPFGAVLGTVSGRQATEVVVLHRILNKYEVPSAAREKERREESIRAMLDADEGSRPLNLTSDATRMCRARLNYWFSGFRPSYRFAAPTGASARPTGDIQDILHKLSDLENWEVSPDLLRYAGTIAYRNHALKRLVRARFRERYPYLHMQTVFRSKHGANGFEIFQEMFKSLVTLNGVSRVATVPKNNETDRVITCEPLWNMICQLSFMSDIRRHMKDKLGYDIETRGDLHKTLLTQSDIATIDLRRASDYLLWEWVRQNWPAHMVKYLSVLRPSVFCASLGDDEVYHLPRMFAPMGSGVTFDVMTFSLLAMLRFDRSATVFGDDIIVKTESVPQALKCLEDMGMQVNSDKSFFGGSFRESCGGMYHDEVGFIESYDISYPTDGLDWIVHANKIARIVKAKQVSFELEGIFLRYLNQLHSTFPRVAFEGTREVSLDDRFLTGISTFVPPGRNVSFWEPPRGRHKLWMLVAGYWQRDLRVITETRRVSLPVGSDPDPHTEIAMFLYRGVVKPVRTKTKLVRSEVCSFSLAPLRSVQLVSVVPT